LGKGAKIAIGCGLAAVLVVVIAIVAAVGFGFWAKKKTEQVFGGSLGSFVEGQKKIDELKSRAATNPFTPPSDGILQESRLVKFLEVRKGVYSVYEKHKTEIEELSEKDDAGLRDGMKAIGWVNEVRLAHAQGLADQGMNPDEYRFMVETVYKALLASEIARSAGTQTATEAIEKAQEEAKASLEKAKEEAKAQGIDLGNEPQWTEAEKGLSGLAAGAATMDAPKENIDLFRKHEAEIKKYSMGGLEFLGL
jgi:hypothetical protein